MLRQKGESMKILAMLALLIVSATALVGCHAEGGVGQSHIVAPR
jgi:hypothetical protein